MTVIAGVTFLEDAIVAAIGELRELDPGTTAFSDAQILDQIRAEEDVLIEIDDVRESLLRAETHGMVARLGVTRWEAA
jgi:hypothetical protein